jgi:diamine N-acetyltransferase
MFYHTERRYPGEAEKEIFSVAVSLRPVTQDNWRAVVHLNVAEDQREFVAPNVYSLAEAAYDQSLTPAAIYADETLIGFALSTREPFQGEWGFTETPYEGELGILRVMVDQQYQGQGYGKQAMQALIAQMSTLPGAEAIILNVMRGNVGALRLYESLGFVIYEENEHACWARLRLPTSSSRSRRTACS